MRKRHTFNREQLAWVRRSKGMTQAEFGAAIGRTGRSIINWEQGKTSPTIRDLERICEKFDLDLSSFLHENK